MKNMNENPCNMCMPMGGIMALKGLEECMIVLHGSQGCSTYMRRHIAEHFNEPVDVGSSSLNEKGTIYGGEKNLRQALDNIIKVYHPRVVGVLTTCLAETIGEDIDRIVHEYRAEKGLEIPIVTVPTPGYGGSHSEGYWYTLRRVVEQLATNREKHNRVNVIIPSISPADIRELKRIITQLGIEPILLSDISDTMDRPYERPYSKVAKAGTRIDDIRAMPGAAATIELGVTVPDAYSPGLYLQETFGVPLYRLPLPVGVEATDAFVTTLKLLSGAVVPESLQLERGRLLDCMIDSHKYNFQGRAAIFGDPELVYAVTRVCMENGVEPAVIASGSGMNRLKELFAPQLEKFRIQPALLTGSDFVEIRKAAVKNQANIAIGHSDGRYIEEKEGIPLVRHGFPIHDRVGGQRLLSVGYTGTAVFLDRITNTLLEKKRKTYRSTMYEKYYRGLKEAAGTES